MADIKVEARENSQKALTMTIQASVIEDAYKSRLAKYAKEMTFKGFRKGKTPVSIVERQIGDYVREEVTYDLINDNFESEVKKLEFADQPLAYAKPVIENEEALKPFVKDKDITATIVYDVFPAVKLGQYKGLSFDVLNAEVKDEDISKEIESLREQNADILTKDGAAADKDIVTVDYCELDENGAEIESTRRNDFTFTLGSSYNQYKIDEDLKGMKAGDSKTITKTYGEDESDSSLRGRTVTLSVKMTKVKERVLPEVDDDFAQDIKEEYKTVQDLKDSIRKDLEGQLDNYSKNEKYLKLFTALEESSEFVIPQSMKDFAIENEMRSYLRQIGRTNEDIEKLIQANDPMAMYLRSMLSQRAEEGLRQQVIMNAIQQEHVITVSDEELEKAYADNKIDTLDEDTKKRAQEEIKDSLEFEKIPDYLIENNTFNKTGDVLSFSDYLDAYYKLMEEADQKKAGNAGKSEEETKTE